MQKKIKRTEDWYMRQCEKAMKRHNLSYDRVSYQAGIKGQFVVKINGVEFFVHNCANGYHAVCKCIKKYRKVRLNGVIYGKNRPDNSSDVPSRVHS